MSKGEGRAALDSPGVRAGLNRYRRNSWLILLAGLAMLIGFAVAAEHVETAASDLQRTGVRVLGRVEGVNEGFRSAGSITVSFVYEDEARTEVIHLDDESPPYEQGEAVVVFVDPDDPGHITLPGETNQSPLTVWPMIFAFVGSIWAIPTGIASLVRVHRQRRLLAAGSWRSVAARYVALDQRSGTERGVVVIDGEDDEDGPHVLGVTATLRKRLRAAGLSGQSHLEIVGDLRRRVVVREPDGAVVVSAQRPRLDRTRRRWLERVSPG